MLNTVSVNIIAMTHHFLAFALAARYGLVVNERAKTWKRKEILVERDASSINV
jgi:hypothetical protein